MVIIPCPECGEFTECEHRGLVQYEPNSVPETIHFVWIGDDFAECGMCFSIVRTEKQEDHRNYHAEAQFT